MLPHVLPLTLCHTCLLNLLGLMTSALTHLLLGSQHIIAGENVIVLERIIFGEIV